MRIVEVPGIERRKPIIALAPNAMFLEATLGKPKRVHHASRTDIAQVPHPLAGTSPRDEVERLMGGRKGEYPVATVSLLIQAAHRAFGEHLPLSLAPEVLWYAICHEVAIHVKQDPQAHARWFTAKPNEKVKLDVRDDSLVYGSPNNDWSRLIGMFRGPLREHVPAPTLGLFLPTFSTTTPESEVAVLVAFMDVVSAYYKFGFHTMCGIPAVRLEGTPEDWRTLVQSASALAEAFPGLRPYFTDLVPVLKEIAATAAGTDPDPEFWRSLYKFGGGSGGPFVNGWITALFAHVPSGSGFAPKREYDWRKRAASYGGFHTNEFPAHVSSVPATWTYFEQEIPMGFAAGILGVDHDDGFLAPRLGYAVYEK
ncbi:MAG: DUF4419 domain-containing protein [bacterium]|nr:DUF4419 domain-containing protein [bacterium]